MDKEQLLFELNQKLSSGEITQQEISSLLGTPAASQEVTTEAMPSSSGGFIRRKNITITKILYTLGALIVALGIIFFIAQIWDEIGAFGRIFVTLVLGLAVSGIGSMLLKQRPETHLGEIFHVIGGILIPSGALVTLNELMYHPGEWSITLTLAIIFAFYAILATYHKNPVLTFFGLANGTAFVFMLFVALDIFDEDFFLYLTMIIGISYIILAHAFKDNWNKPLIGVLNFFGTIGILAPAFAKIFDSGFWEFIYFLLAAGGIILATFIKSRAMLILSTLFLIGYMVYITGEYFADSIGWPISLVILGFMLIGLGYTSITLNKKYIKAEEL